MTTPDTLAMRANGDQDKLLTPLSPLLKHTSQALQWHLTSSFEHGQKFGITTYLRHTLQKPLATIMMASDLAAMRRSELTYKQSPKENISASLELSFFGGVLSYFLTRKDINIPELQKKYNTTAFEVITSVGQNIRDDISKTVQRLIESGAHVKEAKEILAERFAEYGVKPTSKSQLETIFRTQTQIAYASGKYRSEREDGFLYDHLWGYKYVTAGDDRVRPSHAILDGVTLPKDDPFWQSFYPPNGYNCRCQAIPLYEPAKIDRPRTKLPDGTIVRPDVGFAWNAGHVFNALGA